METKSHSLRETAEFAAYVKEKIENSDIRVVFLVGNLGSGKTSFVKELLALFGVKEKVISPTFILQKEYPLKKKETIEKIFHGDVYRFESDEEVSVLGIEEIRKNKNNLLLIEWGNIIEKKIVPDAFIYAESLDENTKKYIWKENIKKRE